MGRKSSSAAAAGSNPTATQSSIALLQERFRHLQRVKEMREERENQRACSLQGERPSAAASPHAPCDQPVWFIHPDLVRPSRPLRPPARSCNWLDDRGDHHCSEYSQQALETSLSIATAQHHHEPDVDTTLHL